MEEIIELAMNPRKKRGVASKAKRRRAKSSARLRKALTLPTQLPRLPKAQQRVLVDLYLKSLSASRRKSKRKASAPVEGNNVIKTNPPALIGSMIDNLKAIAPIAIGAIGGLAVSNLVVKQIAQASSKLADSNLKRAGIKIALALLVSSVLSKRLSGISYQLASGVSLGAIISAVMSLLPSTLKAKVQEISGIELGEGDIGDVGILYDDDEVGAWDDDEVGAWDVQGVDDVAETIWQYA